MKNKKVMEYDMQGWPLSDAYLIELGRITALWSSLEGLVNICIGKLTGYDPIEDVRPFILVNHASFPQKLDIIGALCEQLVGEHKWLNNYKDVIAQLKTAQSHRNKFLHNCISFNPDTGAFVMGIGSARGSLKTQLINISVEDVRKAAMEIHVAMIDLNNLIFNKDYLPKWERNS